MRPARTLQLTSGATLSYPNCACRNIIVYVKRFARLAAATALVTASLGLADLTVATAAQAQVGAYQTHGHSGTPARCNPCVHNAPKRG
jgi:hypothetical protein